MNVWNLGAGIASIASLIFHLSGKGSRLRQFTLPTTTALVGFTIGRNQANLEQTANLFLQDPHLLLMLVVMLLLFGLSMYLVELTKPDAKISMIFLVFLSTIAIPQLIKSYNDIAPMVPTQDYLALARVKESDGYTDEAIDYLKICSRRIDRVDLKKQINEKIANLQKRQFKRESTNRIKLKDN